MLAKQTTTLIGTFYCLDWNPKQSASDIFLFYTQINKQPAKRARQEIEKQNPFMLKKQNNLTLWKSWTPGELPIVNECVLLLMKQCYTITPFPDQDKKGIITRILYQLHYDG